MNTTQPQTFVPLMKKSLSILGITLVLYIICVCFIDLSLTKFIYNHTNHFWLSYSKIFSFVFTPKIIFGVIFIFLVIAAIGLLTRKFKSVTLNYLTSCALIIVLTNIIISFLKMAIGRARPFMWIQHHIVGFYPFMKTYDYLSTPSGHVFITTALVFVIFDITQKQWLRGIALLCLASVVLSRIILLKHFLGDCVFSMGLTWACFVFRITAYNKICELVRRDEMKTSY
jgi:hypothetical protein